MMDLKQAIDSLNVENDDHWTENGLPKLDVIKDLTGKSHSRKEITDAAPLVTRERLMKGESTEIKAPEADKAEKPEVEQTKEVEVKVEKSNEDTIDSLRAKLEDFNRDLRSAEKVVHDAKQDMMDVLAKRDATVTRLDSLMAKVPKNSAVMDYLVTRQKLREEQMVKQVGPSDLDKRLQGRARNTRPLIAPR